jgi:hypothetical protein
MIANREDCPKMAILILIGILTITENQCIIDVYHRKNVKLRADFGIAENLGGFACFWRSKMKKAVYDSECTTA